IQPTTTIEVSRRGGGIEVLPQRIAYEDTGGLERELGSIREMIELPLRYPEIFERLGIEASLLCAHQAMTRSSSQTLSGIGRPEKVSLVGGLSGSMPSISSTITSWRTC